LRRRLIALFAAYAIALASLLTSFGTARLAADAATAPGAALCHTDPGETAPGQQDDGGKVCTDCCCIGCLMLMAALPAAPLTVTGAVAAGHVLIIPQAGSVAARGTSKAHRSRAPPLAA
jgi:hypothetical protein